MTNPGGSHETDLFREILEELRRIRELLEEREK